ncbi:MAG: ABC transporter ATP-binding protein [Anaerolineales bacterium]
MPNSIIVTHDLTREFSSVKAVDSLTLDVPAGIVFGYLGPNGSGKTTTIRLLLGLLEPTRGTAQVLGLDTRTQAAQIREQAGALLEFPGIYERLSAEDNLDFYGRVWHLPAADRQARIRELLTHFDLWDRRKENAGTWSRGMKQKLAVARTIFHRPKLIFLDEPTAGLDPVAAAALREDLAGLVAREGVTVFLTTHNLNEAERLCSQVAVIRQGKLLAVGHPDQLRAGSGEQRGEIIGAGFSPAVLAAVQARPEVTAAELVNGRLSIELRPAATTAALVGQLVAAGAQVEEVRKQNASLEDVFLTLMDEEPAK